MPDSHEGDYLEHLDSLDLRELLALERDTPDDVDLLVRIGGRYLESRELDKSCDYYVRALNIDPYDGWAHLYFGNLLSGLKCYPEAITHFRYAADFLPGVACPHWCLGNSYRAYGDLSGADFHYHKAVEVDPSDLKARQSLEEWLVRRK